MQTALAHGLGSAEQAEMVLLSGYNASGQVFRQYAPVFWDLVNSDCKSFTTCATNPFSNFHLFVGVLQDTVGTADYTARILGYGPTLIRGYGQTGWYPGVPLYTNALRDYAEMATSSPTLPGIGSTGVVIYGPSIFAPLMVAVDSLAFTTTTGQPGISTSKAFVRAL